MAKTETMFTPQHACIWEPIQPKGFKSHLVRVLVLIPLLLAWSWLSLTENNTLPIQLFLIIQSVSFTSVANSYVK